MKKILSILVMLIIVLVSASTMTQAQDKKYTFKVNKSLNSVSTYAPVSHFRFTVDDTVTNNDSTYSIVITLNQDYPVFYDIRHKLDSTSGTPNTTVYLESRKFDSDAWSAVSDLTWAGTSTDTTLKWTENSTAKFIRQLRLRHNGKNSVTQVYNLDELEIKLWPDR